MNILIACENSGEVRDAFREYHSEHTVYSCDLMPAEPQSEYHLRCDVREVLAGFGNIKWDLLIAHPPCTHLAVSGAKYFQSKIKSGKQDAAIDLFMVFVNAPIHYKCIENPIGIMSTRYRKPDQIIQPFFFGDNAQKSTCLWLYNLPKLIHSSVPTLFDDPVHTDRGEQITRTSHLTGRKYSMPKWINDAKQGNLHARERSKTFPGIAKAMATQWGILEPVSYSMRRSSYLDKIQGG
jgi:site-specific DNA-cytosine methylase